jgi:ribosomal-protein-alanine N-acetyltransferase
VNGSFELREMAEIEIRLMREQDIPEILKIERMSFSTPWSEAAFYQEIRKQYALSKVAVWHSGVVGYICANMIFDDCHVLNIAVHPDFRRRKIATELMENILNESKERGCRFFYLEVRASNTGAVTFYESFGFKIAGVRRRYYSSPEEDATLMVLRV